MSAVEHKPAVATPHATTWSPLSWKYSTVVDASSGPFTSTLMIPPSLNPHAEDAVNASNDFTPAVADESFAPFSSNN